KGRNGEKFRLLYKRMAGLDERQAQMLDRIAKNTNRELKQLDDRARQITQQIRLRTPNRRIEQGQKVPLPSPELFDLAKRRQEITANAIRDLRRNMGEAKFAGFSKFLNEKIKPGIRKKGSGVRIEEGIQRIRRGGNQR
ncbi:MAG: hypothetical protein KDB79_10025, partial [Acidobacteria bacterium]|nr:hypothetical protein [Acidobacteriota bacterium]